jgi:hypothetical protein
MRADVGECRRRERRWLREDKLAYKKWMNKK